MYIDNNDVVPSVNESASDILGEASSAKHRKALKAKLPGLDFGSKLKSEGTTDQQIFGAMKNAIHNDKILQSKKKVLVSYPWYTILTSLTSLASLASLAYLNLTSTTSLS